MKSFLQLLMEAIDVTKNENFKKWFGSSKVVDKEGKPLVVYHGTGASFDIFKEKNLKVKGSHILDIGIHFSELPDNASLYANASKFGGKYQKGLSSSATEGLPNVMQCFIKIENPLDATKAYPKDIKDALLNTYHQYIKNGKAKILIDRDPILILSDLQQKMGKPKFFALLQDMKFDGVIYLWNGTKNYLVFSPTQIKSATGNNGNFDPNNPDITK